jgi:hypothetical protein
MFTIAHVTLQEVIGTVAYVAWNVSVLFAVNWTKVHWEAMNTRWHAKAEVDGKHAANAAVSRWLREVASVHAITGEIPAERLLTERARLQMLPAAHAHSAWQV